MESVSRLMNKMSVAAALSALTELMVEPPHTWPTMDFKTFCSPRTEVLYLRQFAILYASHYSFIHM